MRNDTDVVAACGRCEERDGMYRHRCTMKKWIIMSFLCGICMLCGLFIIRSDGAAEQRLVPHYTCEEGIWYKLRENEEIEIEVQGGAVVSMRLFVERSEEGTVDVRLLWDEQNIAIGQVRVFRGGYVTVRQGMLLFAAEITDSTGQEYTCLCRGTENDCQVLKGKLLKDDESVTIEEHLYGGFIKHTEVNAATGDSTEVILQTEVCEYTLIRPLLTVMEAGMQKRPVYVQMNAGEQVRLAGCEINEDGVWYCVENGEKSGWITLNGAQLVFQAASFEEVFSAANTGEMLHYNLNAAPVVQDLYVRSATVYPKRTGIDVQLSEYLPACDERIVLQAPKPYFDVGIVNLVDSYFSPVFVIQYCVSDYDEVTKGVVSRHVCILYRMMGTQLVPIQAEGYETGELYIRLLAEKIEGYGQGYNEEKVTAVAGDGRIEIAGEWYRLQDFNHLVKLDKWE